MYRRDLPSVSAPAARAAALRALVDADGKFALTPTLAVASVAVWVGEGGVNIGAVPEGAEPLVSHLKWLDEIPAREAAKAAEKTRLRDLVAKHKLRNAADRAARAERVARETPQLAFEGIKPALEAALARRDGLVALLSPQGEFTLPCGQTVAASTVWIDDAGKVATRHFAGARPLLGHLERLERIPRVKGALERRAAAARPTTRRATPPKRGPLDDLLELHAPPPRGPQPRGRVPQL